MKYEAIVDEVNCLTFLTHVKVNFFLNGSLTAPLYK